MEYLLYSLLGLLLITVIIRFLIGFFLTETWNVFIMEKGEQYGLWTKVVVPRFSFKREVRYKTEKMYPGCNALVMKKSASRAK